MCRRYTSVIYLLFFLSSPFKVNANEAILSFQDADSSSAHKSYELKIRLAPKISHTKVYWQGREDTDWENEKNNWKFGMINEIIPPIILKKINFHEKMHDSQDRSLWGGNNMRLLIFNPINNGVISSFEFSANSYKKNRTLQISVNDRPFKEIIIPQSYEFTFCKLDNIFLKPGINEITLFCPEDTGKAQQKKYNKKLNDVSLKFKDDMKFKVSSITRGHLIQNLPDYDYKANKSSLDVSIHFDNNSQYFALMSRNLNIDLKEYPYLDLEYSNESNVYKLKVFLGIRFNGNRKIDDYIEIDESDLKGTNILELVKEKYIEETRFKLSKIILVWFYDQPIPSKDPFFIKFRFNDFTFYNPDQGLYIPLEKIDLNKWRPDKDTIIQYKSYIDEKGLLIFNTYFNSREMGTELVIKPKKEVRIFLKDGKEFNGEIIEETSDIIKLQNTKELSGRSVNIRKDSISYTTIFPQTVERKEILEKEKLGINFNIDPTFNPEILKIVYKVEDPTVQAIEVFLDFDNNGDGIVDRRILAGNRETLKGWKFIGIQANMDLYETYISRNFSPNYTSQNENDTKFVVFKYNRPLKTTWLKWYTDLEMAEVGAEPRSIIISVPQGEIPKDNYSIIYFPLCTQNPSMYQQYEANISWLSEKVNWQNVKGISLFLKRKEEVNLGKEKRGWFSFYFKDIGFYKKYAYPLKNAKTEVLELLKKTKIPLIKIDSKILELNDFENWKNFDDLENKPLLRKLEFENGTHSYVKLDNPVLEVTRVVVEPTSGYISSIKDQKQKITFKKINPTKYLAKIENATSPFWLIFKENFHNSWKLYNVVNAEPYRTEFNETHYIQKFTPLDIRYLFEKPLDVPHLLVSGYANGWYIDPKKMGLNNTCVLVIYFMPQSLLYLGLCISFLTILGCIIFLILSMNNNSFNSKN